MRKLSYGFMSSLKSGLLHPALELVSHDSTLCLEIREDCINIYYRGGNIMKIMELNGNFSASFDRKYLNQEKTRVPVLPKALHSLTSIQQWLDAIPLLKHEMDLWFGEHPKNEREFQQLIVRENNFNNSAKSTDYFICDIEYENKDSNGRFDMIAVYWPSSPSERKNNKNLKIVFIEMKYSDSALTENAGIKDHIHVMTNFLAVPANLTNLKAEMKEVFNQKIDLGLIDNQKPIRNFKDGKPEYIFIFANHDPGSSVLKRELKGVPPCPNVDLKFAVSNFMGYGLYKENIYSLADFQERFFTQI